MMAILQLLIRLLITAVLYSLFIRMLYLFWKDLKNQAELLTAYQSTPINLQLHTNPEITMQYNKPEIIIGRDPACDFPIEDRTVSNQHARLTFHHHQWWLEDLGSTNGTLLNLMPVTAPMVVTTGDQITCGQAVITIRIEQKPIRIGG